MWVEINGADYTNDVDAPSISLQNATTDPLASLSFEMIDIGAQIPLAYGNPVTIWDETGSGTVLAPPSRNFLINELLYSGDGSVPSDWTLQSGLSPSVLSFPANSFTMVATFNNVTYTTGNNYSQIYQNCGNTFFQKVYPGQTYMASCTFTSSGTISNVQAFIILQFYDVDLNWLDVQSSDYVTPVSGTGQTLSCQLLAPANAAYAHVILGAQATVSGTNSGTITYLPFNLNSVNLEPVLFQGQYLADGTPVKYPSDTNPSRTDCILLPDQTSVRMRWLFNGYITNLKVSYDGTNRIYQVTCAPFGDVIDNGAIISNAFENTTDQSIITTLLSQYFSGMLASGQQNDWLPPTTVQFGQNISNVAYQDNTMRDVMNALSDSTGFIYYVDEYNYLWYNDTPFNYATITVDVEHADYITAFPPQNYRVEYDGTQFRNSVKVMGGQYYTVSTDPFSGTGTLKDFTLTSQPQSIQSITIGGTLYAPTSSNKIGVVGQSTLGVGGVVVTYDPNSSVVHFFTAPAAGSDNVLITYSTYRNVAVEVEDNGSIGQYNRRFYAKVTDTTIADSATAQVRGVAEVGKYAQPLVLLTFDLSSEGAQNSVYMQRGLTVIVNSALDGLVGQPFTIQQVQVKSQGGGINTYSYTAGVYRPSMMDAMRNSAKALQSNTSGGSTAVQLTVESLDESLAYSDRIQSASAPGFVATYGDYQSTVLADSPKAYYRFDEASGTTATDSSGNGFNGTYASSGVTLAQPGALTGDSDTAVLLDGLAGQMTCPAGLNTAGWSAFTVEVWLNLTALPASGARIADNDQGSNNKGFSLFMTAGAASLNLAIGNGSSHATATYTFAFSTGVLYHIIGTWDGATITLYVDGVNVASIAKAGTMGTPGNAVAFGYNVSSGGGYLPAVVDEGAIYNATLSSARVLAHYNKGSVAPPRYGFASYN